MSKKDKYIKRKTNEFRNGLVPNRLSFKQVLYVNDSAHLLSSVMTNG